ncbi:hypothetical protein AB0B50_26955 [Streptomyces sp. NPDC041068]|uniref:hypothetical protein n=1 Tax=Streptomyces sp. NPDC041068 TaxID=3155130 RepID=UPI0034097129
MSDLHELQLALDLPHDLPADDLSLIRWHLGEEAGTRHAEGEECPLLSARGPAARIGGVLIGELQRGERGWSLTVRQEVHPDEFDALRSLVAWLAARTTTVGTVGHLRFLEDHVPDVLVVESGSARRLRTRAEATESDLLPGPWA